jgi:hypothetical protein
LLRVRGPPEARPCSWLVRTLTHQFLIKKEKERKLNNSFFFFFYFFQQGKGSVYEDFKWIGPAPASYGKPNLGQTFGMREKEKLFIPFSFFLLFFPP